MVVVVTMVAAMVVAVVVIVAMVAAVVVVVAVVVEVWLSTFQTESFEFISH